MTTTELVRTTPIARLTVSHVTDYKRRYSGERVSLHTRVQAEKSVPNYTLTVSIPQGLSAEAFRVFPAGESDVPLVYVLDETNYVEWRVPGGLSAGAHVDYEIQAVIAQTSEDVEFESTARLVAQSNGQDSDVDSETTHIAVSSKGAYLKYLPALYYDDDLMGHLLMLFESFWGPINKQIDNVDAYFDPRMTPAEFLPWLASWADMTLDERWSEERQRRLLSSMAVLHRKRGTRAGLEMYLEIFTGERPIITEHRARNFRLGSEAKLGQAMALGSENVPHTFAITLTLPPVTADTAAERQRKERDRRKLIESIIESEKPAHANYTLAIETA